LAYDRLIRRFQTPAEREEEGKAKGYSGVLEADLWRSEAKLEALKNPTGTTTVIYRRGADGEILEEEKDEVPLSREEGRQLWEKEMELRFLRGDDDDFEYPPIDEGEQYDDRGVEEREAEEKWFEAEEPQWVSESQPDGDDGNVYVAGETGIQDY